MKRTFLFAFCCLFSGLPAVAEEPQILACETCQSSSLVGPVQNLYEPGWLINFHGQHSSLTTGMDGSRVLDNQERQRLTSSVLQLSAAYNFSQDFGLQLTVPYIDRTFRRSNGNRMESGAVSGIGDTTLAARFTPLTRFEPDSAWIWNFQVGVKLPTGNASRLREEFVSHGLGGNHQHHEEDAHDEQHHQDRQDPPIRLHGGEDHGDDHQAPVAPTPIQPLAESLVGGHDLALGSGSVDGLLGTSMFLRQKSFFLETGAQYQLRTRGAYGYQMGNALFWNVSPGFLLVNDGSSLTGLQLNVSGESKQIGRAHV